MKFIPMSNTKKLAIVDDEYYEELSRYKWQENNWGYAKRATTAGGKNVGFNMHHAVLPKIDGMQVDHKNRNTLDNRKENLRYCTASQNKANSKLYKNNTTGFKGVYMHKDERSSKNRKFQARIKIHGKYVNLGFYYTAKEAARAYDGGAMKYFGEFASLNFEMGGPDVNSGKDAVTSGL